MSEIVIGDARTSADIEAFAAVDAESFGEPSVDSTLRVFRAAGERMLLRVARAGDVIVGGYALEGAGQWFGGRSVPAQCVMTVAVDPAWRRQGIAGALLRDLVRTAAERGAAAAPLTAATVRLYRRWGWEIGDRHLRHRVRTDALASLRGAGHAAPKPPLAAVEAMRRRVGPDFDGMLDRPDWWLEFEALDESDGVRERRYGWWEGEELTGFIRYEAVHQEGTPWMRVRVSELVAATRDALLGLLGFVGGLEAQAPEVSLANTAVPYRSELLFVLPEPDKVIEVSGGLCWMQRIVDVERALTSRGWRGADARVELEVTDPMRDEPERVVLEVAGGAGHVEPGGAGLVRLSSGVLASWYCGTLRAIDAQRLGLIDGSRDQLEAMDSAIGRTAVWMPDYF